MNSRLSLWAWTFSSRLRNGRSQAEKKCGASRPRKQFAAYGETQTTITNTSFDPILPRRQRIRAGKLFEELDDLAVARQLANRLVLLFRHQRRCVEAGKLFEVAMKIGVFKRFAERLLEDLHLRLGCPRREHIGRADKPEGAIHRQELSLHVGFRETFDLGQARKAIRPVSFGDFDQSV